jgi:probable rRNA maturation factor
MMAVMSIDINNESGAQVEESTIVALARFVLDEMGIHPLAELSILLVDVAAMEQLHIQWMEEPGPTDVLSFPMDELRPSRAEDDNEPQPGLLGDIVLCPEVAEKQGAAAGHSTTDELHLLTTHGILHLLGYDHADPEEKAEMFALQSELLAAWRRQDAGTRAADRQTLPTEN